MTEQASLAIVGALLSRRYRLARLVGEGAMGAVYEAERIDGGSPKRCAVKVLHQEHVEHPHVVDRFLEEGRLEASIDHPNVTKVFEVTRAENGTPYLVMELLDGVSLAAYTSRGARVPVDQAVAILQGILAGLGAAHGKGIVHRDLKPENVYLAKDKTGAYIVKLLDFGVAKVIDVMPEGPDGKRPRRTRTGMVLGTPSYMSPEQVASAKDVDKRSDLFSAASLFYELLVGARAFDGDNEFARMAAVSAGTYTPVSRKDVRLTPLDGFFAKALARSRDDRFPDAKAMTRGLLDAASRLSSNSGSFAPVPREGAPSVPPPALDRAPAFGDDPAIPRAAPVPSMHGPSTMHGAGGAPPSVASPAIVYLTNVPNPPPSLAEPSVRSSAQSAGSGGTLASGPGSGLPPPLFHDPPPNVVVVEPSKWFEPGGHLPTWVAAVAATVGVALGFAVGYLVGHG